MEIRYCDILRDLHVALDEIIIGDAQDDDFAADMDTELRQAVNTAVEQLLAELDDIHIDLKHDTSMTVTASNGVSTIPVPSDMLRFISMKFNSWPAELRELTDPYSDKARMQACEFTRGTKWKPVAIMTTGASSNKTITVYSTDQSDTLTSFVYVPTPVITNTEVTCALRSEAKKAVMYRAAGIFLETHREADGAAKYYELSKVL